MTATLRVVVDQLVAPTDPALAAATGELVRALVDASPSGCEVEGIVPAAHGVADPAADLPGLARLRRLPLPRRELATAFSLGLAPGVGGGMIHSPTLFAPLVRHDRVHAHDQTVVTLWDLDAWEHPEERSASSVAWHRAMIKRAARHADAVIVPTHAMAHRLAELSRVGDRIRVIAGAAPAGLRIPTDDVGRRRALGLPEGFLVLSGGTAPSSALAEGFAAIVQAGSDIPVVVVDAGEGEEPAVVELASAAGIPERRVHVRGSLDAADRAAVLGAAIAFVAPAVRAGFPWRVVEALALGVPVVAVASPVHEEVIVDGGRVVGVDALGDAIAEVLGSTAVVERLSVLSADRGRVFSWREAAERVWQLHADL